MIKFSNKLILILMIESLLQNNKNLFPKNSKVLVRVDFNVPIHKDKVINDSRILLSIPTLKLLLEKKNAIVLISHLGRPKGYDSKLTLKIIKDHLKKIKFFSNKKIHFCQSFEEKELTKMKKKIKQGEILLLENLRFEEGEQSSSINFAKKISSNLDFFINDAFAVCHRQDSSVLKIPTLFKKNKLPGLLLQKEMKEIYKTVKSKKKKLAIIGGAKVSTKVNLINKLIHHCDDIIIGGAMAFTFIKYLKGNIGLSLYEPNQIERVSEIFKNAKKYKCKIHLPEDVISVKEIDDKITSIRHINNLPDNEMGLDIGHKSCVNFKEVIFKSQTIIWNGPMGMFERKKFKNGTDQIMLAISNATESGSYSLVGGGDTISAIDNYKKNNSGKLKFDFLSSGGGAMLAFLQDPNLPAIKALVNE